ncbi:MAG TPA: AmmeMemoRadiSam system protein B [Candidatus Polarisedimenticolaceae bacterium]|nr:AmmeMemoRadiSam system protein B [Candidatus Polarisedimenticolaceae bacterium]
MTLGPTVAGRWYPSDPSELGREVDTLLARATLLEAPNGSVAALVAPHAGFMYSGAVAARGFALLRARQVARVLLIGPSHYAAYEGAAVPAASDYRTPLGAVPLDLDARGALAAVPSIRIDDGPFEPEHCLEAELPFLQRVLAPGFRLLPLLIGAGTTPSTTRAVAAALAPLITSDTLLVVSSDFTHFGARFGYQPFRGDVARRIEQLDRGAIDRVLEIDGPGFSAYVERTGATICGRLAIEVLLQLLPAATPARLLAYDTSGRMTGDWTHTVSYASLAFERPF